MMADSDKNNTRHGGVDHQEAAHRIAQRTETVEQFDGLTRQAGHTQSHLHSPTIQESGYNTPEASPATTSSSHGTPSQHFDFEDVANGERTRSRQKPNLTLNITRAEENDLSDASETPSSRGSNRTFGGVTHDTITQFLNLNSSRTMSRSFQDLRAQGVDGSDDEEGEAEKDDEYTSSEERYNRESQWNRSSRRCSLRRRNFDDRELDNGTSSPDANIESSSPIPLPVLNFPLLGSHESQSNPDSPTACSVLPQFLEQDISLSSIGIASRSSPPSKAEVKESRLTAASEDRSRRSHEVEQVFRISLSSDEGNCEDSIVNESADHDKGVDENYDDDNVFRYDYDDHHNSANVNDFQPGMSSSPLMRAPIARLRHSTQSSPNIVLDKPPISPSYLSSSRGCRRRHMSSGLSVRLKLSGGASIQHLEMSGSFTVATQTPHRTSVFIQDVMSSPVPVPNEARGTAASRLRRLSESGGTLPPSPAPLPDIIPYVRDRSSSVPDTQAFARRRTLQTGRLVGRELRRMSDEFNSLRTNSTSPSGDTHQYASSFPGFGPLLTFMRGALRSRRGSSVDDDDGDDDKGSDEES